MYLSLISLLVSYVVMFMLAPRELPNWNPRKANLKWYDKLSGARLGTLVSLPPGLVMLVMGAIRQDYSTILMAAVPVLGGVGLWLYAESLAKRPKPNSPSPTVSAKSPSFEAA